MKKILIVEDNVELQELWKADLEDDGFIVFSGYSIDEARSHFKQHQNWDLVIMDGCLIGNEFNCLPLIQHIR